MIVSRYIITFKITIIFLLLLSLSFFFFLSFKIVYNYNKDSNQADNFWSNLIHKNQIFDEYFNIYTILPLICSTRPDFNYYIFKYTKKYICALDYAIINILCCHQESL